MRVLFFNYEYPPLGGGAGNATSWIMREFSKMPYVEVDLITSSIDNRYHLDTLGENIFIHRLPIGKDGRVLNYQSHKDLLVYSWKAYRFSLSLLKKKQYDLSHSFFSVPCGFLSYRLKKHFGLPYIVSLRGSDVPGYSERFLFLYKILTPLIVRIWKHAEAVVANSGVLKKLALQSNERQKVDIIYNGVNTERFFPLDDASRKNREVFTWLCASRLSRRKGFRYAIDAFAKLYPRYPEMRLIIAGGEGEAEAELKEQARSLGLDQAVTFTGYIPNEQFYQYYQAADVFVFPSFNEGMSNNMLEAMACGLPVIMTPTGGAEELVHEGENGYIIRMADSEDIAEKVERLIVNRDLALRMGQSSRKAAEKMSWAHVAREYVEIYSRIASKHE